ncbi:MAG TPA: nuclear transport factor 2 family protein [Solirubrobacterales bacterium]|jgi:ketosteroid isomerase-like protein|nr:nuclear transport factor 2 family protein [Solirubrobacterales bacterium]
MSQENIDVIREAVDALNRRDVDAFIAFARPDVEWKEPTDPFPGLRPIYHGRDGVREWLEEAFLELWESFHVEVGEITEASDDRVFFEMWLTARGAASGVETVIHTWSVTWHADDGKVARRALFWTREEGLEAAGLSE